MPRVSRTDRTYHSQIPESNPAENLSRIHRPGRNRFDGIGVGRGIGDINADGHDDLIIAAYTNSDGAEAGGKAYLYSGKDGSLVRTITDRITNDNFGVDALALGDVDNDGLVDYLITAVGNSFAENDTGWAYIVKGLAE